MIRLVWERTPCREWVLFNADDRRLRLGTLSVGRPRAKPAAGEVHLPRCRFYGLMGPTGWQVECLGGTVQAVMRDVEREIDRRSIGLFGLDDVSFSRQP